MEKKIILSAIVIFAIGVVGCGKSDEKKVTKLVETPKISNQTSVTHIGEVNRVVHTEFSLPDFDENMKLDNGENLIIAEDDDAYYVTIRHANLAKNIQFYIDADSDSKTGYKEEGGAEFLVENGQLYSLDKNAKWKKYTDTKISAYNAEETQDTIKLDKKLVTSPYFGVKAQVLDDTWIPKFSSPKLDTFPKTYYKINTLTKYEDFSTSYISSKDAKAEMFLDDNNEKIDILLSSEKFEDKVQLYIDSDNKKDTGFQPKLETNDNQKINMWVDMGADYQITENSQLFSWDKNKKDWIYVEDIPYVLPVVENKKSIIIHLLKSSLKNIDANIKLSVITYDNKNKKDWKIRYAMPELNSSIPQYKLK